MFALIFNVSQLNKFAATLGGSIDPKAGRAFLMPQKQHSAKE